VTSTVIAASVPVEDPLPAPASQQDHDRDHIGPSPSEARRLLTVMVMTVIFLQRFGVPAGSTSLPFTLPAMLGLAAYGVRRGILRVDRVRLVALSGALCFACVPVLVNTVVRGGGSLQSFGYLIAIYAPFALVTTMPGLNNHIIRIFAKAMLFVAAVAVLQTLSMAAGLPYTDLLGQIVPSNLLIQGFNTSYPVVYGSPLYKANAFIFLEPSFLSQFLGAAIVARLWQRKAGAPLALLVVAMLCTVAGTGMVLALVGLLLISLSRRAAVLTKIAISGGVGLLLAAATPFGTIVVGRLGEHKSSDSSTSLRFTDPFVVLGRAWLHDWPTIFLGRGPGTSERAIITLTRSQSLQAPVPIKLVYDYGAVLAIVFILIIGWCCLNARDAGPLCGSVFFAYIILNSALLIPTTVFLLWLLAAVPTPERAPPPAEAALPKVQRS
jgi:hypothetical protein